MVHGKGDRGSRSDFRFRLAALVLSLMTIALGGCDFLADITSPAFSELEQDLAEAGDLIIAGDFTAVNDVPRPGIARVGRDGVVDEGFVVDVDGVVLVAQPIVIDGEEFLFIGGDFSSVNGVPRPGLAAIDSVTGALLTTFTPLLGPSSSGRPGIQAILPVPERQTLIVGGTFSGAASDPATGTLDSGFRAVAELRWSDGGAVESFRPTLLPPTSGDPVVYALAPGLGEIGAWSVVVGGRFGVDTGSTGGLILHALAALDGTGTVRALAEPATDESSAVYSIRSDPGRQLYRIAGGIRDASAVPPGPEDYFFYGGVYYIEGAGEGGINDFMPDESEPLLDGTVLFGLATDGVPTGDGRVLVAGIEGFYSPPQDTSAFAVAALFDGTLGVPGGYLTTGGTYPDALVFRIRPVRSSYYLVGAFDTLIDTVGVGSGPTIARVDHELRVDPLFSVVPTGSLTGGALPAVYELVELPLGF